MLRPVKPDPKILYELERNLEYETQETTWDRDGAREPLGHPDDMLNSYRTWGTPPGRPGGLHVRPMFQVMPLDYTGFLVYYDDPCAACQNFAYSWKCARHPERDLDRAYEVEPPHDAESFVRTVSIAWT